MFNLYFIDYQNQLEQFEKLAGKISNNLLQYAKYSGRSII